MIVMHGPQAIHSDKARKLLQNFYLGDLVSEDAAAAAAAAAPAAPAAAAPAPAAADGPLVALDPKKKIAVVLQALLMRIAASPSYH